MEVGAGGEEQVGLWDFASQTELVEVLRERVDDALQCQIQSMFQPQDLKEAGIDRRWADLLRTLLGLFLPSTRRAIE